MYCESTVAMRSVSLGSVIESNRHLSISIRSDDVRSLCEPSNGRGQEGYYRYYRYYRSTGAEQRMTLVSKLVRIPTEV